MITKNKCLKTKALYFLSRREYSYKELFSKLHKYTENLAEIHQVLQELEQKGWLSEERYITHYLHTKSQKYGLLKIKQDLVLKTGKTDLIDTILAQNPVDEYETAHKLWQKKFGFAPVTKKDLAQQIRFLQNKGFSFAIIKQLITSSSEINDDN